jgi:hypothetical protein
MKRGIRNGTAGRKQLSERVPITVRMPEDVIKRIDRQLAHRDVPLSRNNWLLEAAIEKLRKNGNGESNGS